MWLFHKFIEQMLSLVARTFNFAQHYLSCSAQNIFYFDAKLDL